jgi:hypothetical protein
MIEIVDYKSFPGPTLIAQVSIRLPKWGGFIIKRIKVFQKNEARWIQLPCEKYEKNGQTKFFTLCEFETPAMNEAFRTAFFKSYDDYISLNNVDQKESKIIPF